MNNPFLTTYKSRLLYIGIWTIIILVQILLLNYTFRNTANVDLQFIIYDSLFCNVLQAVCLLALWYPVRYYRNTFRVPLFLIFHLLLLLIAFSLWLGMGYLLTSAIVSDSQLYTDFFLSILPSRLLFGLMIYVIFVLIYYLFLTSAEVQEQVKTIQNIEIENSPVPAEKLSRISVKKNQEIHFLQTNQVVYIEANGDYVLIYTKDNKFLKDRTMKYWETHLPDDLFVRVHRSFIVNIEYIARIELYEKDSYRVLPKTGNNIKVSTSGYKLLKQKMLL